MWHGAGDNQISEFYRWVFLSLSSNLLFELIEGVDDEQLTDRNREGVTFDDPLDLYTNPLKHWNCLSCGEQVSALCEVMIAILVTDSPNVHQTALLESAAVAPFAWLFDGIVTEISVLEDENAVPDSLWTDHRTYALTYFYATHTQAEIAEIVEQELSEIGDPMEEDDEEDSMTDADRAAECIAKKEHFEILNIPKDEDDPSEMLWRNVIELIAEPFFADRDWQIPTTTELTVDSSELYDFETEEAKKRWLKTAPDYYATSVNRLFLSHPIDMKERLFNTFGTQLPAEPTRVIWDALKPHEQINPDLFFEFP